MAKYDRKLVKDIHALDVIEWNEKKYLVIGRIPSEKKPKDVQLRLIDIDSDRDEDGFWMTFYLNASLMTVKD